MFSDNCVNKKFKFYYYLYDFDILNREPRTYEFIKHRIHLPDFRNYLECSIRFGFFQKVFDLFNFTTDCSWIIRIIDWDYSWIMIIIDFGYSWIIRIIDSNYSWIMSIIDSNYSWIMSIIDLDYC